MAHDLIVRTYDDDDYFARCGRNLTMQEYVAASADPTTYQGWRLVSETAPAVLFVCDGTRRRRYPLQNILHFDVVDAAAVAPTG